MSTDPRTSSNGGHDAGRSPSIPSVGGGRFRGVARTLEEREYLAIWNHASKGNRTGKKRNKTRVVLQLDSEVVLILQYLASLRRVGFEEMLRDTLARTASRKLRKECEENAILAEHFIAFRAALRLSRVHVTPGKSPMGWTKDRNSYHSGT